MLTLPSQERTQNAEVLLKLAHQAQNYQASSGYQVRLCSLQDRIINRFILDETKIFPCSIHKLVSVILSLTFLFPISSLYVHEVKYISRPFSSGFWQPTAAELEKQE